MAEAELFQRLTLGELYRRRVETASQIATVSDGAEWIQGFIDFHCPDATRILDFPHAAQRICQLGEAVLGADHTGLPAWQTRQLHTLKHHDPAGVLDHLRTCAAAHLTVPLIAENLAYLDKRLTQMQYPLFQAQGWPIGSGMVERANKVLVEARLKGAGMHWSRAILCVVDSVSDKDGRMPRISAFLASLSGCIITIISHAISMQSMVARKC